MTDAFMTAQASIKARYHPEVKPTREAGRYVSPSVLIAAKVVSERTKASLIRDTKTAEHARGIVWEDGHFHKLPGTAKLAEIHAAVVGESPAPSPSLLNWAA